VGGRARHDLRGSARGQRAVQGLKRAAAAGAVLALAAAGCRGRREPEPPPAARHVVLVTIDTLRADRLGAYGHAAAATPHLDRIAGEGVLAADASAHVPLTRPSHVTLFTGRLPTEHGIRDNVSPAVLPDVPVLAQLFRDAGFRTAAFVSSVVLSSESGLDRGFESYSDRFAGGSDDARFLSSAQRRGDQTLDEAVQWLEANRAGRLFLWVHLYDPHDPYEPPEPYLSRYADRPYDGEVAWSDELVGRLDAALARLGLGGQALLVVTSDHGEGLGDHGEALHGFFTYQTTLRVPLILRGPGLARGKRLSGLIGLVDLFPTLLDLAGVPPPAGIRLGGTSFAATARGGPSVPEAPLYAESLVPLLHFGWSDLRVVRDGRWKYVQAPRPELYDLQADPGERTNLLAAEPARAEAFRKGLARFLAAEREASPPGAAGGISTELLERLGALGYVGGGGAAEAPNPGADPKDMLEEFRVANALMREGLLLLQARRFEASAAKFKELLARRIQSFELHFYLARALAALERHREAAAHYQEASRRAPIHAGAWEGLAESRARLGDLRGALEAVRQGQAALPRDVRLRAREAALLRVRKEPAEARRVLESALPLAPRDALLRAQLGELLRDLGDVEGALARLREAVALAPENAAYANALGMTLGAHGRPAEAEQAFRDATRRDPANARYAYNLGLILARQGRVGEARAAFEKALALQPGFAPARERLGELATRPSS
jgi:choline-sulfatase